MAVYSLKDDYDFGNVSINVSVKDNPELKVEFLTEMVRETDAVLMFRITIGGSVVSRPVIEDGIVYFGACDKNVYAVGLNTGEEIWRFPTQGQIIESIALDEGRVYAGSYDGKMYALDRKGNLIWEFNAGDKIASAPQVHGGNIYFGCKDGNVYALDRNGSLLWKFRTNGPIGSPVTVYKDRIYAGSLDYNLYSIDLEGNLVWKFAAKSYVGGPCIHRDVIHFGSFDKCVYAMDMEGRMLWKFRTDDIIPVSTNIAAHGGVIYFGSRDNNLYAVKDGRVLWKFKTSNMILSKPVIDSGMVYFCSTDGNLYALDAETGREKWRFPAGGPALLPEKSGDVICFGCYDCNLYAINTRGELLWKFHTSLEIPSEIDFTPETEHTILVPVPEDEADIKEEPEQEERRIVAYGDFKGNYLDDEMKDYTGVVFRDAGDRMIYKSRKRVYKK